MRDEEIDNVLKRLGEIHTEKEPFLKLEPLEPGESIHFTHTHPQGDIASHHVERGKPFGFFFPLRSLGLRTDKQI